MPYLREDKSSVLKRKTSLWVREAVIAVFPLKPGISRFLPIPHAPEERFHGLIYPFQHILQDLGVDLFVFFPDFFDLWQLISLIVVANGMFFRKLFAYILIVVIGMLHHAHVIGIAAFLQSRIVQGTASVKSPF